MDDYCEAVKVISTRNSFIALLLAGVMGPTQILGQYCYEYDCVLPPYVCEIGVLYNVTCDKIARLPIINLERNDILERERVKAAQESISIDMPYLIPTKTHRMWLTSSDTPKEVPLVQLGYYNSSLQHYLGKDFEHHFWCNDRTLIPQTIEIIKSFNVPVIIHEIAEVIEIFITKSIFQKLIKYKMFAFASNLARREILVQHGGLYADIGIEQLTDLEWVFKKSNKIICVHNSWLDNHFLASEKNSDFFKEGLKIILPVMRLIKSTPISITAAGIHGYLSIRSWQLVAAVKNMTTFTDLMFYEGRDYKYHGMRTWDGMQEKLSLDYLLEEENNLSNVNF